MITLLDYGAGNVRSVINAIESLGETVRVARTRRRYPGRRKADFSGCGRFRQHDADPGARRILSLRSGPTLPRIALSWGSAWACRPCFEGSEEAPGVSGLGFISGTVKRFHTDLSVPHIGWNGLNVKQPSAIFNGLAGDEKVYFVHSYHVVTDDPSVVLTTTDYGYPFVSAVQRGRVVATQFHPEKSGETGLRILGNFIRPGVAPCLPPRVSTQTRLAKRIIACLDVRTNDRGDLVVTKGDQYDVREEGEVRNLGKPVDLARRYYQEGADEITFLNITGFGISPWRTCR